MVKLSLDGSKIEFTTKNFMDEFNIEETVVPTKGGRLRFFFQNEDPYFLIENESLENYSYKEYAFESNGSVMFFLQKLALNSNLMMSLSNDTLVSVANEILANLPTTLNLVVDKNTDQILTVTSMSANLVSWRKILEAVNEAFSTLEEKPLYLTTSTGLGISIRMNNATDADWDVLRIEPQSTSSIAIHRGVARESIPLRGYDEDEILDVFKEKLQLMIDVDPSISKNYSLVRD